MYFVIFNGNILLINIKYFPIFLQIKYIYRSQSSDGYLNRPKFELLEKE